MGVVIKIEVKDNNVEQALRVLKRKLQKDGFYKIIKLKSEEARRRWLWGDEICKDTGEVPKISITCFRNNEEFRRILGEE